MPAPTDFAEIYAAFDAPISVFDCGEKCAPYNGGVPVCCDTGHSVPTAYTEEWVYLQENTDLWHPWAPEDGALYDRLAGEAGPDLILIECQGAARCQRDFRSLVCRAFPFFPYIDSQGNFLGLATYWEYEDRCWVISNLDRVTDAFRAAFVRAHERLFELKPEEVGAFAAQSNRMRSVFSEEDRSIPLLHRDGSAYEIDPRTEALRPRSPQSFPKHDPFIAMNALRFPEEIGE